MEAGGGFRVGCRVLQHPAGRRSRRAGLVDRPGQPAGIPGIQERRIKARKKIACVTAHVPWQGNREDAAIPEHITCRSKPEWGLDLRQGGQRRDPAQQVVRQQLAEDAVTGAFEAPRLKEVPGRLQICEDARIRIILQGGDMIRVQMG